MYKNRNNDQRLHLEITDHPVVFPTYPVQRFRCLKWSHRREQDFRLPIRISCADIILHRLCSSCKWVIHMTVQHLMQLKYIILSYRYRIKAFMYNPQHIPVTCYLFLGSVLRCGLLLNQLLYSCICCDYTLYGIGRLRALDLCYLNKLIQFIRTLS